MAQPGGATGFNWARWSMATKGIFIAGGLLFIDLFLPWNRACFGGGQVGGITIPKTCVGSSIGWSTAVGVLAGLFLIALLVWEGLEIGGALANVQAPKALISAGLAAATALFALLRFLLYIGSSSFGAWIGVILALSLGYAAFLKWQESRA